MSNCSPYLKFHEATSPIYLQAASRLFVATKSVQSEDDGVVRHYPERPLEDK